MSAVTGTRADARRAARRRDARREPLRLVGGTLVVWLLLAVGSVSWWPVYRDGSMVAAAVTAVVAGSAVALAGAALRLPALVVGVATAAAFAVTGVPAAVPSEAAGLLPTGPGLVDLAAGVALDWKRLVTISLPVGSYESLLVPFFVTLLVATVTAVSVATRASRPELASIPALVLFAAGVVVGPTRLDVSVASAVLLGGIALVWALTVRYVRRAAAVSRTVGARVPVWRSVLRPALVGTGTIVAAGVVATGLGLVVPPAADRTVARSDVVKPFDPRDHVSPLSGFRAYEESGAADAPQLTVTGLPAGGFVRIATLDTYDGVVYRVGGDDGASASGTFERVPTSVDVRGVSGTDVRVDVRVDGYRGVWLPTVGDLRSVTFQGSDAGSERGAFFYNRTTSTGAVVSGVGDRTRYQLDAVVPDQPTDAQLADARPGTASVPTPSGVPDAVRERVDATTADAGSDGAKLLAAVQDLKRTGYVSHGVGDDRASRSGHGADRIQELLTSPLMIGDQEQYAVTAALMARELGFPARVVMGFTAGGDAGGDAAETAGGSGGTTTFRGSDVTARIEVDTAQYGWVMLDPNPVVREIPEEQDQTPQPVTRPRPSSRRRRSSSRTRTGRRRRRATGAPRRCSRSGCRCCSLPCRGCSASSRWRPSCSCRSPSSSCSSACDGVGGAEPRPRAGGSSAPGTSTATPSSTEGTTSPAQPPARRPSSVHRARAGRASLRWRTARSSGRTTRTTASRTGCGRRPRKRSGASAPGGTDGNGGVRRCPSGPCGRAAAPERGPDVSRRPAGGTAVVRARVTTMGRRPASVVDGRVRTNNRDQMRTLRVDAPRGGDLLR